MKFRESWAKPVEDEIKTFFYSEYFEPLLKILKENPDNSRFNSRFALIAALRSGRVKYENGVFTGSFNARISRELVKYAEYNGRSKQWTVTGDLPSSVRTAGVTANIKARELNEKVSREIDKFSDSIPQQIENIGFSIRPQIERMGREADKDIEGIAVIPEMTEGWKASVAEEYTENLQYYIKNWHDEQILRLREMVQRNIIQGVNRKALEEMIKNEWGVSANKAHFLARQETQILTSSIRDERYQDAGITRYRWSASLDERTRPEHRKLHGQIIYYSSPPVSDAETGRRAHAGYDFGCRCTAIPIL